MFMNDGMHRDQDTNLAGQARIVFESFGGKDNKDNSNRSLQIASTINSGKLVVLN